MLHSSYGQTWILVDIFPDQGALASFSLWRQTVLGAEISHTIRACLSWAEGWGKACFVHQSRVSGLLGREWQTTGHFTTICKTPKTATSAHVFPAWCGTQAQGQLPRLLFGFCLFYRSSTRLPSHSTNTNRNSKYLNRYRNRYTNK